MENKIFSYPLMIKEAMLDTFGHVNNATYLELLEEARWELITQAGYGLEKIRQTQLGPAVLEIHIKYLKELHLRDTIDIQTQMISYQGKIGKLLQRMIRRNEICCEAELTFGWLDLQQRRLVEPTEGWLNAMGIHSCK